MVKLLLFIDMINVALNLRFLDTVWANQALQLRRLTNVLPQRLQIYLSDF